MCFNLMKKTSKAGNLFLVISTLILLIVITFPGGCLRKPKQTKVYADWDSIKARNKIVAVTDFNSTNYFVYKGIPLGFQYELLEKMAKYYHLDLEVKVCYDLEEKFRMLRSGEADIIATDLAITRERKREMQFTYPLMVSRQVLVQRKKSAYTKKDSNLTFITSPLQLGGKMLAVKGNSAFIERMQHLSDEIGDTIYLKTYYDLGTEDLIRMVAKGEIDYTVCDEHVALVNAKYYNNLDVSVTLSLEQNIAWAVRKNAPVLLDSINAWLEKEIQQPSYRQLFAKYYTSERPGQIILSEYHSIRGKKISPWDKVIQEQSKKIGYDWRLVASLIYEESNFIPNLTSWGGAYGLMQLMPATLERFGIDSTATPEQNIAAGIQLLGFLDKNFQDITDNSERVKFVLASYNLGLGHVEDARRLAVKYKRNPNVWDNNVEFFLREKDNPKYYRDPEVKSGYCRGEIACNFVNNILERFMHYKNVIPK